MFIGMFLTDAINTVSISMTRTTGWATGSTKRVMTSMTKHLVVVLQPSSPLVKTSTLLARHPKFRTQSMRSRSCSTCAILPPSRGRPMHPQQRNPPLGAAMNVTKIPSTYLSWKPMPTFGVFNPNPPPNSLSHSPRMAQRRSSRRRPGK